METIRVQHQPGELRFSLDGAVGVLEFVMNPAYAALVFHRSANDARGCDGKRHTECEAEGWQGTDILARWRAAGGDDAVIACELVDRYAVWQLQEHLGQ